MLGFDANHSLDLSDALDDFLSKHKLLQVRWWLLLLMREGTLTPTFLQLAAKAVVRRVTMIGLIDGLEREGLVVKIGR